METGTNHKTQFLGIPVPRITASPADARGAAKTEVLAFRGRCGFSGGPLIDWRETQRLFLSDAPDEC